MYIYSATFTKFFYANMFVLLGDIEESKMCCFDWKHSPTVIITTINFCTQITIKDSIKILVSESWKLSLM